MREFTSNITLINTLATRSPGYLWRLIDEDGPDAPRFPEHPSMTFTLSVWRDVESLRHFTWNTLHKRFRSRRTEWFVPMDGPYLVLWWVEEGHRPDGDEAQERLSHLAKHGPSDAVFGSEALVQPARV